MKKIIDNQGSDNGPFSSQKKSSKATDLPSEDHLKSGKSDLAGHPGLKNRKYTAEDDQTKKSSLKYGSRRNLL